MIGNSQGRPWRLSLLGLLLLCCSVSCPAEEATPETLPPRTPEIWPQLTSRVQNDEALEQRVQALLAELTLEQKVGQMMQAEIQSVTPADVARYNLGSVLSAGGSYPGLKKDATVADWVALADEFYQASMNPRAGPAIPLLWGIDAVHGHNNVMGATIFPHNIGLGAMQNPDLIELIGRVTAREVAATGIKWVFAPTVAVARDERWGRTYESYSEDPTIVFNYAGRMVEGLQGAPETDRFLGPDRVIATAKHWVGDGGTINGKDQGDNWSTEQGLMIVHGQGYFSAIEAGSQTVMVSFNAWQGEKLHGHEYLIQEVLKNRMGFDGLVVSDWDGIAGDPGAGRPGVTGCTKVRCDQAVNAGIDIFMAPTDWKALHRNVVRGVKNGSIPLARIDDAVTRILRVKLRAGLFEDGAPSKQPLAGRQDLLGHPRHREIARQAVRESLVLLKNQTNLLPLAPDARVLVTGPGADNIAMQAGGWSVSWQGEGNSNSDFPGGSSILDGVRATLASSGGTLVSSVEEQPDVAIVVFGETPYAEFMGDRKDLDFTMDDDAGLQALRELKALNIPTVAVFITGRPLWVEPELAAADAFVVAWLPGSEGNGVADVLFRAANGTVQYDFTGRLTFSWPRNPDQFLLNRHDTDYDPLFPYGYGLSYQGDSGSVPVATPTTAEGESIQ